MNGTHPTHPLSPLETHTPFWWVAPFPKEWSPDDQLGVGVCIVTIDVNILPLFLLPVSIPLVVLLAFGATSHLSGFPRIQTSGCLRSIECHQRVGSGAAQRDPQHHSGSSSLWLDLFMHGAKRRNFKRNGDSGAVLFVIGSSMAWWLLAVPDWGSMRGTHTLLFYWPRALVCRTSKSTNKFFRSTNKNKKNQVFGLWRGAISLPSHRWRSYI